MTMNDKAGKKQLWTPKGGKMATLSAWMSMHDSFGHQNLKEDGGTEYQVGQWLQTPKQRHGSEHQIEENDGPKCQTEDLALNA